MNVQPASFAPPPAPVTAPQPALMLLPAGAEQGVQPGWHKADAGGLTSYGRAPADPAARIVDAAERAPADLPPQQVIAGPPLTITAMQPGALPQDRAPAMPAAAPFKLAAASSLPPVFRHSSKPIMAGLGPEGLHWRSPPPGMLTALQEGGRARIATLFP